MVKHKQECINQIKMTQTETMMLNKLIMQGLPTIVIVGSWKSMNGPILTNNSLKLSLYIVKKNLNNA